jgi:hypothetical protein
MQRDRGAAAHHSRLAGSQRGEATVGCKEVNCCMRFGQILVQYMYEVYMGLQYWQ